MIPYLEHGIVTLHLQPKTCRSLTCSGNNCNLSSLPVLGGYGVTVTYMKHCFWISGTVAVVHRGVHNTQVRWSVFKQCSSLNLLTFVMVKRELNSTVISCLYITQIHINLSHYHITLSHY
jgi:hypothetical protein